MPVQLFLMIVVSKLWIFRSEAICLLAVSSSWPCRNTFSWHRLRSPVDWINNDNSNHRVWRWAGFHWVLSFSSCLYTVTLRGIAQVLFWLPWLKMVSKETSLINQAIKLDRGTRNCSIKSCRKTPMQPHHWSFPGQKGSISYIFHCQVSWVKVTPLPVSELELTLHITISPDWQPVSGKGLVFQHFGRKYTNWTLNSDPGLPLKSWFTALVMAMIEGT